MKTLNEFKSEIKFLLTDIDDTLTDEGLLGPESYSAIWRLHRAGVKVIPVTGRPAGWCEMIARMWPVAGVIGENGGFYFRYFDKKMHRFFPKSLVADSSTSSKDTSSHQDALATKILQQNKISLKKIETEILRSVPGSAVASDQFCRLLDLAIDFCEDVPPLPKPQVQKIVDIFKAHGAQAKVSSIHVNGWFGKYDKLTTSLQFLKREFSLSENEIQKFCAFSGDSPNDEPMFAYFQNSFAVANIKNFSDQLKHPPHFVSDSSCGSGFVEIANRILFCQN